MNQESNNLLINSIILSQITDVCNCVKIPECFMIGMLSTHYKMNI